MVMLLLVGPPGEGVDEEGPAGEEPDQASEDAAGRSGMEVGITRAAASGPPAGASTRPRTRLLRLLPCRS